MNMKLQYPAIALAFALLQVPSLANAADTSSNPSDITSKEMKDHPGTKGGATADPTAKPSSGDVNSKVQGEAPTNSGGMTANPTAGSDPANGNTTSETNASNALKTKPGQNSQN
jgi:hypothetical protein